MRVIFCVSGNGILMREAVVNKHLLGIDSILCVAEGKASKNLEDFCVFHGVDFVRLSCNLPRATFDEALTEICINANADLIALTFDKLLPPKLVCHYKNKIINVHLALLPSFKGFGAIKKALIAGVTFSGATIHVVTDEMDGGPILVQTIAPIDRDDTPESFGKKIFPQLRDAWLQTLSWISQKRVIQMSDGRFSIKDAKYSDFPTCPGVEIIFPPFIFPET